MVPDLQPRSGITRLKQCRHGPMLFLGRDRYLGRSLDLYGEYSEAEIAIFSGIVKPGDTVVELGSNIGAHTIPLARMVGPEGTVYAFEPQRVLFTILNANIALNDVFQVRAFRGGAGRESGLMKVPFLDYAAEANFGGISLAKSGPGEDVPVSRVDAFGFSALHLLKADVEGMETDIIAGARETIRRCRPAIYVENDRKDRSPGLIALLGELGYDMWWHIPMLFNPDNFAKHPENVFGGTVSINLLCHPKEKGVKVPQLRVVAGPGDWWNIS